jgi:hypothetical protein
MRAARVDKRSALAGPVPRGWLRAGPIFPAKLYPGPVPPFALPPVPAPSQAPAKPASRVIFIETVERDEEPSPAVSDICPTRVIFLEGQTLARSPTQCANC